MGASRGKMPLESNGVGINSRRVHAESVVSAFQHPTYTTQNRRSIKRIAEETISEKVNIEEFFGISAGPG